MERQRGQRETEMPRDRDKEQRHWEAGVHREKRRPERWSRKTIGERDTDTSWGLRGPETCLWRDSTRSRPVLVLSLQHSSHAHMHGHTCTAYAHMLTQRHANLTHTGTHRDSVHLACMCMHVETVHLTHISAYTETTHLTCRRTDTGTTHLTCMCMYTQDHTHHKHVYLCRVGTPYTCVHALRLAHITCVCACTQIAHLHAYVCLQTI